VHAHFAKDCSLHRSEDLLVNVLMSTALPAGLRLELPMLMVSGICRLIPQERLLRWCCWPWGCACASGSGGKSGRRLSQPTWNSANSHRLTLLEANRMVNICC